MDRAARPRERRLFRGRPASWTGPDFYIHDRRQHRSGFYRRRRRARLSRRAQRVVVGRIRGAGVARLCVLDRATPLAPGGRAQFLYHGRLPGVPVRRERPVRRRAARRARHARTAGRAAHRRGGDPQRAHRYSALGGGARRRRHHDDLFHRRRPGGLRQGEHPPARRDDGRICHRAARGAPRDRRDRLAERTRRAVDVQRSDLLGRTRLGLDAVYPARASVHHLPWNHSEVMGTPAASVPCVPASRSMPVSSCCLRLRRSCWG